MRKISFKALQSGFKHLLTLILYSIMNFINRYFILFLILIQTSFVFFVFRPTLLNPNDYILQDKWDGIKNYYTYQAYLNQPVEDGWSKLEMMNYPYGEYIFYTDNTPLLALTIKLFSHYIYNINPYGIYLYNLFVLSGILLSTFFLYKIFRDFKINLYFLGVFSIALPWINPQLLRLHPGHMNLSLAWLMLAAIYLLFRIYENYHSEISNKKHIILLCALTFLSAFLHVYHLMILLICIASFIFCWASFEFIQKRNYFKIIKYLLICSITPLVLFMVVIRIVDRFYKMRNPQTEGYNWVDWKLNFSSLFTPYTHNKVDFIIESRAYIPYESYAYLGIFSLMLIIILSIACILRKTNFLLLTTIIKESPRGIFLFLLFISSLISLSISLGPEYYTEDYVVTNYLNPFYYLQKITMQVTQFRCLGRFVWIFYWSFNLILIYIAYRLIHLKRWYYTIFIYGLTFLTLYNTAYTCKYFKTLQFKNTLSPAYFDPDIKNLLSSVDKDKYQAILTIPFYHSGYNSEGYIYTIDPDDYFCTKSYQLSIGTGLPLMPAKLGRTPVNHVKPLLSIFTHPTPDKDLLNKLSSKPVLVLYDSSFYEKNSTWPKIGREPAETAFNNGKTAIEKYSMRKIAQSGRLTLLEWKTNE